MKVFSNFFARIKGMWQLSGVAAKAMNYAATYPGLDDSAKLRLWLRPALLDLSVLAALTDTIIDDNIAWTALRIVDSEKSWTAVYSLIVIATDSQNHLITGFTSETEDVLASTITILDDIETENPAVIIAAIGLLVQIFQLFRNKRAA